MSGFSGTIAEPARLGIIPAQNHDPSVPINRLTKAYGARVIRDPKRDLLQHFRPEIEDPEKTYGDFESEQLWLRVQNDRPCSAWFWGPTPSVLGSVPKPPPPGSTQVRGAALGALLPLRDVDTPDPRFVPRAQATSPWASRFPAGWTGLAAATVEEYEQRETWHPDSLGVIAPSFGDFDHGTRVFDTTGQGAIDKDRWAYLQQHMCVVDMGQQGPCNTSGKVLATQLGGTQLTSKLGHALYVDHQNEWVGSAAQSPYGGPLILGPGCKHSQGKDADGNDFRPVHLSHEALVLWPGVGDGPTNYESDPWIEVNPDGPHWQKAHVRFDPNPANHRGGQVCGKRYTGAWDVEFGAHVYIPDPERDRFPPRQPPPPQPPEGEGIGVIGGNTTIVPLPTGSVSTGESVAGGGTGVIESGAVEFEVEPFGAGFEPDFGNPGSPETEVEPFGAGFEPDFGLPPEPELEVEPFGAGFEPDFGTPIGFVEGGDGPIPPLIGNGGSYRPAYPHMTGCLTIPGLQIKGLATAPGAVDLAGALVLTPEQRAQFEDSPIVGSIAGYGANSDGQPGNFTLVDRNTGASYATGAGGLMVLPAGVAPHHLANGNALNDLTAYFVIPPSVGEGGVKLALAQPDFATGGIKDGIVISGDSSGLLVSTVDSAGNESTPEPVGGSGFTSGAGPKFTIEEISETLTEPASGNTIDTVAQLPEGAKLLYAWAVVDSDFANAAGAGDYVGIGLPAPYSGINNLGRSDNGAHAAGTTVGPENTSVGQEVFIHTATSIRFYANNFTFASGGGSVRVTAVYQKPTGF